MKYLNLITTSCRKTPRLKIGLRHKGCPNLPMTGKTCLLETIRGKILRTSSCNSNSSNLKRKRNRANLSLRQFQNPILSLNSPSSHHSLSNSSQHPKVTSSKCWSKNPFLNSQKNKTPQPSRLRTCGRNKLIQMKIMKICFPRCATNK